MRHVGAALSVVVLLLASVSGLVACERPTSGVLGGPGASAPLTTTRCDELCRAQQRSTPSIVNGCDELCRAQYRTTATPGDPCDELCRAQDRTTSHP